jgi:hypothetical protein
VPKKLLLLPPLAFARVGTSNIPVDWILWGPNDAGLDGTTKTTAVKFTSFDQQSMQGEPASDGRLVFEDDEGIRPVCPYFELWEVGTGEPEPLLDPQFRDKVTWTIELANLKGFYRTRRDGDKVLASRTVLRAETGQKLEIQGCSPDI